MNASEHTETIEPFEPGPDAVYSIETAAHLTHVPRRNILLYCRHHLISPVSDPEQDGYYFDTNAIHTLRRIEFLHSLHGINFTGVRMILELVNALEQLQAGVHGRHE